VRFHDDKSSYTGSHIYRFDSDASADHMTVERHERLRRRSDVCDLGEDGNWVACKKVFHAFVGKDCDGKEFAKLCRDCSLVDNELTAASCDVIFSGSVAPGKRRMNFDEFKVACGKIAAQKSLTTVAIQQALLDAGGPKWSATLPDKVRFHDDTSTYTGAHIERCNAVGAMEHGTAERHQRLRRDSEVRDVGDAALWVRVKEVYSSFAEHRDCDGREFAKLCKDCNLCDNHFKAHDVDVIFSSCLSQGCRRLDFDTFKIACGKIAIKRGTSVKAIQNEIIDSEGPKFQATQSDKVRFHDDKSTYTGIHYGK